MLLTIDRQSLQSGISQASVTLGAGTDLFSHFVFRIKEEKIELFSSNGRAGIVVPLTPRSVEGETSFAVEGWRMKQWLSGTDSDIVTLSFDSSEKVLTVQDGSSSLTFRCLSSENYPFWDSCFKTLNLKSISAFKLIKCLNFMKGFVAENKETEAPELSVTEASEGILGATNIIVLSLVESEIFKDINFRIHGKDLPIVLKFLSTAKDEYVEVDSTDKGFIVKKENGTIFMVSKPPHAMKRLMIGNNHDYILRVSRSEILKAMKILSSVAEKENDNMNFQLLEGDLVLSLVSEAGGRNEVPLKVTTLQSSENLPEQGFKFSSSYFQKILEKLTEDELNLEIFMVKNKDSGEIQGGLLKVREENDGDIFTSALVWKY